MSGNFGLRQEDRRGGSSADKPEDRSLDELLELLGQSPQDARLISEVRGRVLSLRRDAEESKAEGMRVLRQGFAAKEAQFQQQLADNDAAVSKMHDYYEGVVADLTDKSHRDPKTKLLNLDWFTERFESFLAVEQRARWCSVGVVDINSFKWYNDNLGHAIGDRIIEGVALILADQIRSRDFLAIERSTKGSDLHARFGGDEYCFLIPDLPGPTQAVEIAARFKDAVESHDWSREDPRLARRPVKVDVGVVCLRLGPITERRGVGRRLAAELIQRADKLMYDAKGKSSFRPHSINVKVGDDGHLTDLSDIA